MFRTSNKITQLNYLVPLKVWNTPAKNVILLTFTLEALCNPVIIISENKLQWNLTQWKSLYWLHCGIYVSGNAMPMQKYWLWCSPRSAFSVLQWETLPGGPSSSLDRCGDGCRIAERPRPRTDRRVSDRVARYQTNPRSAFYNWRYFHRFCKPKITIPVIKSQWPSSYHPDPPLLF